MSGSGGFGFEQSKTKSRPDVIQDPQFAALKTPFAQLLLGLIGGTQPSTGVGHGTSVTLRPQPNAGNTALAGLPQYTGQLTAPMAPGEQAALDALSAQTGPNATRDALLEKTLAGHFLPGQPGHNPFLQASIQSAMRPVQEAYEESTRQLRSNFTRSGHQVQPGGSSPFDRAAAIESRGLAQALSDIGTKMSAAAYESERGRQQEAIPLSQQEVNTTIQTLQAQALPRMIQQHGLDKGLELFQNQTQQLLALLQILGGITPAQIANRQTTNQIGFNARGGSGDVS